MMTNVTAWEMISDDVVWQVRSTTKVRMNEGFN